jgi:hypothetical protein
MNEREIKGLAIVGGIGLLGIAIVNQVYQAGVSAGLAANGNPVTRIDGHGGFPFPPFLLLVVGGIVFLTLRRRRHDGGPGPFRPGVGGGRPPRLFEEWHRQAHDEPAPPAPSSATPRPDDRPERPVETSMV